MVSITSSSDDILARAEFIRKQRSLWIHLILFLVKEIGDNTTIQELNFAWEFKGLFRQLVLRLGRLIRKDSEWDVTDMPTSF